MNFQHPALSPGQSHSRVGPIYFPAFDYLRIVLAMGVFVSHAHFADNIGNACVQIFFALSGFLIGGILLKSNRRDLARFYYNRSTRIWIPYLIAILLLFAATTLKQSLFDPKLWEFFFYKITFVYNWFGPPQLATSMSRMPLGGTGNHFWSICVEEQFYLLIPFVLLFMQRWLSIALLVTAVTLNCLVSHDFAAIALGVLLAISREHFGVWYNKPAGLGMISAVAGAAAITMLFGLVSYFTIFPLIAVCIVGILAFEGKQSEIGKILGGMSFSFYLNHWIGLFIAHGLLKHTGAPLAWSTGFGAALLMSWCHYRFIDLPIARNRSAFFTEGNGYLACAAGFTLVTIGAAVGFVLKSQVID